MSPFSVGNRSFAFTADVTGLQTFPAFYEQSLPLGTLSEWGWHTIPSANSYQLEDAFKLYDTYGRDVPYASQTRNSAGQWLRANPHRLHLGRVGFPFQDDENNDISMDELKGIKQTLNMWKGVLQSDFQLNGHSVHVETICHPQRDMIAVRVKSSEDNLSHLPISFAFPYGSENWGPTMADWNSPEQHNTTVIDKIAQQVDLKRTLDQDEYFVRIAFSDNCEWKQQGSHSFQLVPQQGNSFEFTFEFSPEAITQSLPNVTETMEASSDSWEKFWSNGGVVELHGSSDPRAEEFEQRIVLSQYLTAIQSVSSTPPQESGLTHNSWYGKFHLEMHWWHSVHFALWNRHPMFEKSLPWYRSILSKAQQTAKMQGYEGARWPKMVGPDGREGPSGVGVFLIWQQPHPIYYAELCYRTNPTRKTLKTYQEVVFETAEFMASYAHWDEEDERYILGPPLIPA